MTDIKLDILPQRSTLPAGHAVELYALVRAYAPSRPDDRRDKRLPLNLSLVLDRSGSMGGKPLEEAKRCASYIVDQLDSRDRLSLVTYDDRVNIVVPTTPVIDKAMLKRSIHAVNSGGATALFNGWHEGAIQCRAGVEGQNLSRVLLLSDGCANKGRRTVSEIAPYCAEMFDMGVSTSTYGLGHRFNEELMVEMANAGGGQSYYGESAEDLLDPFQEEFSLMSALCARQLKLTLQAPQGVRCELLNDYHSVGDNAWLLPELAYDGEAWALVKLTIPGNFQTWREDGHFEVLNAFLSYTDVEGDAPETRAFTLQLPRVSHDVWAASEEDQRVVGRMEEIRVSQLQQELRKATLRRDWTEVDRLIVQAQLEAGNNAWVRESLTSLKRYARGRDRERLSKEALYASRKLNSRLAERDEDSRRYRRREESSKAGYLRKKMEQGKCLDLL